VTTAGLAGPMLIVRRLKTVGDIESLSYFSFGLPICRRVGIRLQPTISCGVPPSTSASSSWFASWLCLAPVGAIRVWFLPLYSPQQHTDPSVCIMTRNSPLSRPNESRLT